MENRLVRCLLMTAEITSPYGMSMNDLLPRCDIKSCLLSVRSLIKSPSPSTPPPPPLLYPIQLKPEVLKSKRYWGVGGEGNIRLLKNNFSICAGETTQNFAKIFQLWQTFSIFRFRESRPQNLIFVQIFLKYFHKIVSFDKHFDDKFCLNIQKKYPFFLCQLQFSRLWSTKLLINFRLFCIFSHAIFTEIREEMFAKFFRKR